ncbi:MAG: metallophosphoesterase [Clostridia bacterium]|nr:metallophosphoesterase [Clostridia bacterium]
MTSAAFRPVLRFAVATDPHIRAPQDPRLDRVRAVFDCAYAAAQADDAYPALDAVVFTGDLADNGTPEQFELFRMAVTDARRAGTAVLAVVAKNHDGWTFGKRSRATLEAMLGQTADFHRVLRGFHFIGLSTSENEEEYYSDAQRDWLAQQLADAAAADADRPIFVFHHEHVKETVYGSSAFDGWGHDFFIGPLTPYPQVVDFSGHSHYPLNDPRSLWQGAFTAVGAGSLSYAEFTANGERKLHPPGHEEIAQFWLVEVDAAHTLRLRGFDAFSGRQLCVYTLSQLADASQRQYTPAQREAGAAPPVFPAGAAVTVAREGAQCRVTLPAAQPTDDGVVFLYRLAVTDAAGVCVEQQRVIAPYWLGDLPQTVGFLLQTAPPGATVAVTAENAYGQPSASLTANL